MQIFKSRTFWTALIGFVLAGWQTLEGTFEPNLFILIQGVLAAGVMYFRANPKVNF